MLYPWQHKKHTKNFDVLPKYLAKHFSKKEGPKKKKNTTIIVIGISSDLNVLLNKGKTRAIWDDFLCETAWEGLHKKDWAKSNHKNIVINRSTFLRKTRSVCLSPKHKISAETIICHSSQNVIFKVRYWIQLVRDVMACFESKVGHVKKSLSCYMPSILSPTDISYLIFLHVYHGNWHKYQFYNLISSFFSKGKRGEGLKLKIDQDVMKLLHKQTFLRQRKGISVAGSCDNWLTTHLLISWYVTHVYIISEPSRLPPSILIIWFSC